MTRSSIDLSQETLDYIIDNNYIESEALRLCREETAQHARSNYQISREQASFMGFMTRLNDTRIAIEIGVYTGYSALTTISAMVKVAGPTAHLFALDVSHEYLDMAKKYWEMAKLDKFITPMVGNASDSLQKLLDMGYEGRVDQIFIDADKAAYPEYVEFAYKLLRKSGLIMLDNMFLSGRAISPKDDDKAGSALNALSKSLLEDKRFDVCLTSVGDGISLLRKL